MNSLSKHRPIAFDVRNSVSQEPRAQNLNLRRDKTSSSLPLTKKYIYDEKLTKGSLAVEDGFRAIAINNLLAVAKMKKFNGFETTSIFPLYFAPLILYEFLDAGFPRCTLAESGGVRCHTQLQITCVRAFTLRARHS